MANKLLLLANDETTIYNFRRELLQGLAANGYDLTVAFPVGSHTDEIEACGCRVVDLPLRRHGTNPFQDFQYYRNCRRLIREVRPAAVLTYTVKPNIYGGFAARREHVPCLNNITGLGTVLQRKSLLASISLFLQKRSYRSAACVFFQNHANYRTMLENGVVAPTTPVQILPGSGVNLALHAFTPYRPDDGTTRFLIVSRIRQDKGFDEFFAAAEMVRRQFPSAEFHVVGWYEEDSYRSRLEELSAHGTIIYHGRKLQEEVHQLMAQSDCVVLPSWHEGMANVLLEAASTGRIVVASDIPGCREAFEEGQTGFGCQVKNAASLASALEKVIRTPYAERRRMGERARQKMEREFDRKLVVAKYLQVLNEILRNGIA